MILDNEDESLQELTSVTTEETSPTSPTPHLLSLSTAAFYGIYSPQALRVTDYINNQPVIVRVDSGSTHNIIQTRVVQALNLAPDSIASFLVMVVNGAFLRCDSICPNLSINLYKALFTIPFFIILVEGPDIILGLAWLRTLGLILVDFSIPQLTFNHGPSVITLKGEPYPVQLHHIPSKAYYRNRVWPLCTPCIFTLNHLNRNRNQLPKSTLTPLLSP